MKAFLLAIPFALAVCLASAQAADKPEMKKPDAPAGTDGSWSGTLGASQGKGVAVLHIKQEKDKKSDLKELVLWADTDSLKNEIATALSKHSAVKVNGSLAPNNSDVKVTSITVEEMKKKGKGK